MLSTLEASADFLWDENNQPHPTLRSPSALRKAQL